MFDVNALRQQFPALNYRRDGKLPIYFDGAAGTQVPRQCIDGIAHYLSTCNANTGGVFASSIESDGVVHQALQGMADFLNATSHEEIIFGQNMTTLTLHMSRAIGRTLKPGDEIVVTRLDHDANSRSWVLAAHDAGATVRWVDIHLEDCTLDLDDLKKQLTEKTRLVAVTAASNLVGTRVDVPAVVKLAHAAGAWVFVDAVHYAPHGLIDVQQWGCDFLACSAYKFYGPHLGVLWGRRELLTTLTPYKLRPTPETLPGRWMTGTQSHEALAGLNGSMDYLSEIGSKQAEKSPKLRESSRRPQFQNALAAIQAHERELTLRLLQGLQELHNFKVWGVTSSKEIDHRVPTFALSHVRKTPLELAQILAKHHVFTWSGNMYAIELAERLGVEEGGGLLRISPVHYNTLTEIDNLLGILAEI